MRPTEAIHLGAIAILAVVTVVFYDRLANPDGNLLAYGALAAAIGVIVPLAKREDELPAPVTIFLDFYPAIFLPILFNTLSPLIMATRGGARDDLLIAADRAIFGVDVTVWLRALRPPRRQRFLLRLLRDLLLHRPVARARPVGPATAPPRAATSSRSWSSTTSRTPGTSRFPPSARASRRPRSTRSR